MTAQLLRRAKAALDSRYGKKPEDRTVEDLLKNGLVIIDKPMGPTSHQIAAWIRDMFAVEKAGHGGTLDPRATGVLPVGFGNTVRAMDYIHEAGKRYIGLMRLHAEVDDQSIERVLKEFTGDIFQMPPVRSAVKRAMRTRKIFSLQLLERDGRNVLIDVKCQGGTYVRSLCVDIGDALGIGAHLQELRRIEAGPFTESESIPLHALKDAIEFWHEGEPKDLRRLMLPMERIFSDWKKIIVKDSAVDALCHGAGLALPGVVEFSKDIQKKEKIALLTIKEEIVASGIALMSASDLMEKKDGMAVELERVFMEPGTYPRSWASKANES